MRIMASALLICLAAACAQQEASPLAAVAEAPSARIKPLGHIRHNGEFISVTQLESRVARWMHKAFAPVTVSVAPGVSELAVNEIVEALQRAGCTNIVVKVVEQIDGAVVQVDAPC